MSRRSLVRFGTVFMMTAFFSLTAAAQSEPAPAAPVELPLPPVSVTQEPEAPPASIPEPLASIPAPAPASTVFEAMADTLTVLVDYRAEAEIQRDLQSAEAEKVVAERSVERARMLEKLAASRIEMKASEIKALEAKIDYAKSTKNNLQKNELEGFKKFAGVEKQLLEHRRELRGREIETARALRDYHEAAGKACRLELELAGNRREHSSISSLVDPGAAAEAARLQQDILKLEGRVLEAQVQQAGKRKDLADQEVKLGNARRAVYESQLKVAKGGR